MTRATLILAAVAAGEAAAVTAVWLAYAHRVNRLARRSPAYTPPLPKEIR